MDLIKDIEAKSKALQEQHEDNVMMKRVVREMKQNLETTKQEKVEIERENTRLRYLTFYHTKLKYYFLVNKLTIYNSKFNLHSPR